MSRLGWVLTVFGGVQSFDGRKHDLSEHSFGLPGFPVVQMGSGVSLDPLSWIQAKAFAC